MSFDILIVNTVTFCWLGFWFIFALYQISSGTRHSILFIVMMHFVYSGIPLLLDMAVGMPDYLNYPGMYLASEDETTSIVYCLYVSLCPVIWWLTGRRRYAWRAKTGQIPSFTTGIINNPKLLQRLNPFFYVLIVSLPIALLLAPDPRVYAMYASMLRFTDGMPLDVVEYHAIINNISLISLIGAAGLLASSKRLGVAFMWLCPWLILNIWVNGKRYIIALIVIMLGYLFWARGYVKKVRFILVGIIIIPFTLGFMFWYQATIREVTIAERGTVEVYQKARIDYGRDDVIKIAVFAELYPEIAQILEYRGQSLFYYLILYIPREIWPDNWPEKPLAYTRYNLSAMKLREPIPWTWGITTSWLAEAIANFSWLGICLGPLLLSVICRFGDAARDVFITTLTVLIGILFLSTALNTFFPLFFLWGACTVYYRHMCKSFRKQQGNTTK